MTDAAIFAVVDHTLLSPTATWADIKQLCEEALVYKTASVCIPPSFVKRVKETYGDSLVICTVIGFPLGYNTTLTKLAEMNDANENGADEFDVVINIGDAKDHHFSKITDELTVLKQAVGSKIVKVIIETCYLTTEEKIALSKCVTQSGADFIKTSTGFGTGGATIEDIRLFKEHIGPHVKIKAAGGMKTREDFVDFINEGASRLGTSSAVKVLTGGESSSY
ncbi:MAG: deoxyribose-phosphate aldolase [Defluviitaleaceae bacterium]|nr:deoxyribose-phosphate aldolase [Defluviitaleaceae bacterium]